MFNLQKFSLTASCQLRQFCCRPDAVGGFESDHDYKAPPSPLSQCAIRRLLPHDIWSCDLHDMTYMIYDQWYMSRHSEISESWFNQFVYILERNISLGAPFGSCGSYQISQKTTFSQGTTPCLNCLISDLKILASRWLPKALTYHIYIVLAI